MRSRYYTLSKPCNDVLLCAKDPSDIEDTRTVQTVYLRGMGKFWHSLGIFKNLGGNKQSRKTVMGSGPQSSGAA